MSRIKSDLIYKIFYKNAKGEESKRDIFPTMIPPENIKAIDLTQLSEEDRNVVVQARKDYSEYVKRFYSTMFSFEEWAEHSGIHLPEVNYRTFNQSRMTILNNSD